MPGPRPVIGITADATAERYSLSRSYGELLVQARAVPLILPCIPECVDAYMAICDGFILSGGDDPDTRRWGVPLHPEARPIDPARQDFELALLDALRLTPDRPVLGVCLGMQMMALHAGGVLDQFLPETLATAGDHWGRRCHPVEGECGEGQVHSHHRQAVADAGSLRVVAAAPDGVIEAVADQDRAYFLGVQWHPERTDDERLGFGLIERLVESARRQCGARPGT